MKQVVLYLPVIHAGYEDFLDRHADAQEILLLGDGFLRDSPHLATQERALTPRRAAQYLRLTDRNAQVRVVEPADLPAALVADIVVLPDEQLCRDLVAGRHLDGTRTVIFDATFLRWGRSWANLPEPALYDEMSAQGPHLALIELARTVAEQSSDWWRHVGAVAARDGEVIGQAWNRHHPTEYAPYLDGDPRDGFERGVRTDLSTAIHAEAALIAQATRGGTRLDGADIYTTTFPCPVCARLIADAGFRRCFFARQYSVPEGRRTLRAAGVRLIWVDIRPDGAR